MNYIKKNKLLWPILLVGFLAHMAMIFSSGTNWCYADKCGLYFFGIHGTDSVWHLALSAVSFQHWPFRLPVYAGASLGGYNYLMDLIIYIFSKLGLPIVVTFFKIFPVFWFIFYTSSAIRLSRLIHDSKLFVAIMLLLSYFCGSLAYIYTFWHHGTLWGSSGLAALQALHALANMQYAFSLVILMEVLIILIKDRIEMKEFLLLSILLFLAVSTKFYGGVITVFIVGLFLLTKIVPFRKESMKVIGYSIVLLFVTAVTVVIFYNPAGSSKTGAIFSFIPLATVHPTLESSELFYFPDLVNARYTLQGSFGPRLAYIETLTLIAFLIGNFGVRVLGVLYFLKNAALKKAKKWEILVFFTIIFATLLNILLVQKGEWWNTVQFLYYGIFLSTIFLGQFLYSLMQNKNKVLVTAAFLIILISLPINIDLMGQYNGVKSFNYIPQKELDALNYLKKQPDGVVFQPLYDTKVTEKYSAPYPMFANADNAYVAAFSKKQVYYSTNVQIRLVGVDYIKRLERLQQLDCDEMNSVKYAYIVTAYRDNFFTKCIEGNKDFIVGFKNEEVRVYKRK
ncbi:MAG: hypothetical protein ABIO02_04190 [Patescibacteria group bacterium]